MGVPSVASHVPQVTCHLWDATLGIDQASPGGECALRQFRAVSIFLRPIKDNVKPKIRYMTRSNKDATPDTPGPDDETQIVSLDYTRVQRTIIPAHSRADIADTRVEVSEPLPSEDDNGIDHNPVSTSSNFEEKYVIEEKLGEGGMGIVYSVRDATCRRKVAMKKMHDELRFDDGLVSRFIAEAQIAAQLEHPSIVPVYELGAQDNGTLYYTMKYVRGLTLKTIINEIKKGNQRYSSRYNLGQLLNIYRKLCEAVAYTHSRGVIHRDLKPENIMIGAYGEVMLVDWGLAKILDKEVRPPVPKYRLDEYEELSEIPALVSILPEAKLEESINTINTDQSVYGQPKGSPYYMPPEQALGKINEIDSRSDIYALGGILYTMLCLRTPVTGKSVPHILKHIEDGEIQDPLTFNESDTFAHCADGKIPKSLAKIAMKALEGKKEKRYQTVIELLDDFDRSTGSLKSITPGIIGFLIGSPKAKRRTIALVLLTLAALAIAFSLRSS